MIVDGTDWHGDGDCFKVAGDLALRLADDVDPDGHPFRQFVTLCHGLVVGQAGSEVEDVRYWHAWVEVEHVVSHPTLPSNVRTVAVIDLSNGNDLNLPRDLYYKLGRIGRVDRYSPDDVRSNMVQFGTYGPWLDDEDRA